MFPLSSIFSLIPWFVVVQLEVNWVSNVKFNQKIHLAETNRLSLAIAIHSTARCGMRKSDATEDCCASMRSFRAVNDKKSEIHPFRGLSQLDHLSADLRKARLIIRPLFAHFSFLCGALFGKQVLTLPRHYSNLVAVDLIKLFKFSAVLSAPRRAREANSRNENESVRNAKWRQKSRFSPWSDYDRGSTAGVNGWRRCATKSIAGSV